MNWLNGKKTYITAGLMVFTSLFHLFLGDLSLVEFITSEHVNTLLEGIGLGTLRAGVAQSSRF